MISHPEIKIKKIRELKNYSQEYVADKLGLSTRAYSKIETGETQLTINRLNELSEIFEVDPIEVLGFDDKQIFNNCEQHGNIGVNHINFPEELMKNYEKHLHDLKEEISFLRSQLKTP